MSEKEMIEKIEKLEKRVSELEKKVSYIEEDIYEYVEEEDDDCWKKEVFFHNLILRLF